MSAISGGAPALLALEIHNLAGALHVAQGPVRGQWPATGRTLHPRRAVPAPCPARLPVSYRGSTTRATVVYGVGQLTEAFSMGVSDVVDERLRLKIPLQRLALQPRAEISVQVLVRIGLGGSIGRSRLQTDAHRVQAHRRSARS